MYRVVSCLVTEHDTWLVLLAVVVCVATALTSFLMYSIAEACSGRRKLLWAALTGVSAGSGIWATHFVAMLAYKGALPTHYEPVATIGSLLIAIAVAAVGFAVSTGGNRWWIASGWHPHRLRHRYDALRRHDGSCHSRHHRVGHPSRRCLLDTRLRDCGGRDAGVPRPMRERRRSCAPAPCSRPRSAFCISPRWVR